MVKLQNKYEIQIRAEEDEIRDQSGITRCQF